MRLALEAESIEARAVWKPMHRQSAYADCEYLGRGVADLLFERGLYLPSGSALEREDQDRVIEVARALHEEAGTPAA